MVGGSVNLDSLRQELNGVLFRAMGRDNQPEFISTELRQIAERIDEERRPLWTR